MTKGRRCEAPALAYCFGTPGLFAAHAVPVPGTNQRRLAGGGVFESAIPLEVVVVLELRARADVVEHRAQDEQGHAVQYLQLGLSKLAIRLAGAEDDEHGAGRDA